MSPLPAWLHSPPPTLALDIDARRVTAVVARRTGEARRVEAYASTALPPGAVVPSLTAPNVLQPEVVVAAIRRVLEQVGGRHRRCALVVPDTVAKVTLLRFEEVPANPRDLEQLIRLQLRKALPFPVEQGQLATIAGLRHDDGHEFLAVAARRDIVESYEAVGAAAGLRVGAVDIATLNVVNAVLLAESDGGTSGDWLLVHVGADYSSLAIVRDGHVIFFRTRQADAQEDLADAVHQTRMYFEDRLAGRGFARVLLAGGSESRDAVLLARELEARLGVGVQTVDVRQAAALGDRVTATPDTLAALAAPTGLLLRAW